MNLKILQQRFSQIIHDQNNGCDPAYLGIRNSGAISSSQRLAIYSNAYWIRMLEALEVDFSETREALGAKKFGEFSRGFIDFHRSKSFTLNELGSGFPDYLASLGDLVDTPYFADLAKLEWKRILADWAAEPKRFDFSKLGEVQQDLIPFLKFRFVPSVSVLETQWSLLDPERDQNKSKFYILLYKSSSEVSESYIAFAEYLALTGFLDGLNFGEVAQRLENAKQDLGQLPVWFQRWGQMGIVEEVLFTKQ